MQRWLHSRTGSIFTVLVTESNHGILKISVFTRVLFFQNPDLQICVPRHLLLKMELRSQNQRGHPC